MIDMDEWKDMLPHTIEVKDPDDESYYPGDETYQNTRVYRCLVDTEVVISTAGNNEAHTVGMKAYVGAIPVGATVPVDISEESEITVTDPAGYDARPIKSLARHYDQDGTLHNIEILFT